MRLAALLLLTLAAAARADGPPATTDEDRKRGADLVAGWTARKDALLGATRLRVHEPARGDRVVFDVSVEAAPASEPAAVYRVVAAWLDGDGRREVLLLDARLAIVSHQTEDERGAVLFREARRPGGGWTYQVAELRCELPEAPTTTYADELVLLLLARSLPRRPATYELPGFAWEIPPVSANPPLPFGALPRPVVLQLGAPTRLVHRGREVEVVVVRGWLGPEGPTELVVDAEGRLLEVREGRHKGVAEPTAEEDLAAARAAARIFIKVKVKALDPAALDEVVDWAALKASAEKANPALVDLRVEDYAQLAKEAMRGEPTPPGHEPEKAFAALDSLIKLAVQGDVATSIANGRVLFRLRRVDDRWRITELP